MLCPSPDDGSTSEAELRWWSTSTMPSSR